MDEEKEVVSLLNSEETSNSDGEVHFDQQPRLILRYSITLIIALSLIAIFLAMVLSSSAFSLSNKTAPIVLSPYPENLFTPNSYELYVMSYEFLRIRVARLNKGFANED